MSNSLDESELSSALYLNQGHKTKSSKSRGKSTVATTDNLGLKIRVIKGLIDIRMMLKRNMITLITVIITCVLINMVLQLTLFYFLYINTGCGTSYDTSGGSDNNYDTSLDLPADSDDSQEALPKKKNKNNENYFWMTQIYQKIESSNDIIISSIKNFLKDEFRKMLSKLDDSIADQEERTRGFYLFLENAGKFEFQTPKGRSRIGSDPRTSPKNPSVPRPPRPTRKTKWIGPTGFPGYANSNGCG